MSDQVSAVSQERFMTPQEVSSLLQVSVYTVRRWLNEGHIPAYKVGRVWRVRATDLDVWLSHQALDRHPSVGA